MKKQKMSLERMRGVLSNVLSREEMKEVMAGSGDPPSCAGKFCQGIWGSGCVYWPSFNECRCDANPLYYWCS